MSENTRETLAGHLDKVKLPQAKKLVKYIRQGNQDGKLPCWGAITDSFDKDFEDDEQRIGLWRALVESGEKRALLLFVHACRGRPEVIKEVLEDADSLPIVVQRALVSIKAFEKQVKPKISDFSPSVQQLASSDTRKLRRMRQSIKAHIAKLMSLRFSTGDPDDPEKKERAAARNLDSDQ